jgi:hypothetical protein
MAPYIPLAACHAFLTPSLHLLSNLVYFQAELLPVQPVPLESTPRVRWGCVPVEFSWPVDRYHGACESFKPWPLGLILTTDQGETLRVFKHGSDFISTYETDHARDPLHIRTVSTSGHKDDNLFPSILEVPLNTGLPLSLAEERSRGRRHGYPICMSKTNYEWYPYLPAVVNFRYPIFRWMSRSPDIIHDGSGYRLADDEMSMWKNVEHTMLVVSKAMGSGQTTSLEHREPDPPSQYGYTRSHVQLKFAQKAVLKSLNAFQRLLAYCCYTVAGAPSLDSIGTENERFYSPTFVSHLYRKLDPKQPDVHILAKLLMSSLWQVRTASNFTGVVVSHLEEYDYVAVLKMLRNNVPVYVSWPSTGLNPYTKFRQHHLLKQFYPTPEQLEALNRLPAPQPAVAPAPGIRYGVPPTSSRTYNHPLDYVNERIKVIPAELEKSPSAQSMRDRLASAMRNVSLGSAAYFWFEPATGVDGLTGQEKICWARVKLSKHNARRDFDSAPSRYLWYAPLFSSPLPSLNGLLGSTASEMSGTFPSSSTSRTTCPPLIQSHQATNPMKWTPSSF